MKRNFFYNFLLTGSKLLFPLLTFPYLTRILGADGLGISNFITSYGQNYIIIAALGIPVYGIREIAKVSEDKKKYSRLFFELLIIHFVITCLLLTIYFSTLYIYPDFQNYRDLALLGGALIFFNVFSIEWLFSGLNDFKYITFRTLIIRGLSVLSIFLFVKRKEDIFLYFLILVITLILKVILDIHYSRKFLTKKIKLSLRGILSHTQPVFFLGVYMVLTSVYSILPNTLLGFLSTKSAVGYYYAANNIIRMVISLFSALITVMIPRLNLIVERKESKEYLLLIKKSMNVVISFGIPVAFFIYLIADPLVMLLAGEKFMKSVFVIRVMAPIILLVAFAQVFVLLILSVHRKDKEMVILSALGMAVSIIINLIFIPYYAERATGFSQLLSELLVTVISFFLAKKILNFSLPYKKILYNLLCVIPFGFITHMCMKLNDNLLILTFSGLLCGLYFYFYQCYILKDKFFMELIVPYRKKFTNTLTAIYK